MCSISKYIYLGFLALLSIALSSCSPKTLSVFFDGVPDPNDTVSIFAEQRGGNPESAHSVEILKEEPAPKYNFHSPYKQKECSSCHDPKVMGQFLEPQPGLCYRCHENFTSTYSFLHGPVATGYCTSCHSPHMAENKYLLKITGQQLCYNCHSSEQVLKSEYHEEIDGADCTDCHNPHGGTDRFILN